MIHYELSVKVYIANIKKITTRTGKIIFFNFYISSKSPGKNTTTNVLSG